MTALKDQWKRAPVNSIGGPHARARAVVDSPAVDFYFAIIRSATGLDLLRGEVGGRRQSHPGSIDRGVEP